MKRDICSCSKSFNSVSNAFALESVTNVQILIDGKVKSSATKYIDGWNVRVKSRKAKLRRATLEQAKEVMEEFIAFYGKEQIVIHAQSRVSSRHQTSDIVLNKLAKRVQHVEIDNKRVNIALSFLELKINEE